eukprot:352143-Chlamydomonas_euryale.AAC.3
MRSSARPALDPTLNLTSTPLRPHPRGHTFAPPSLRAHLQPRLLPERVGYILPDLFVEEHCDAALRDASQRVARRWVGRRVRAEEAVRDDGKDEDDQHAHDEGGDDLVARAPHGRHERGACTGSTRNECGRVCGRCMWAVCGDRVGHCVGALRVRWHGQTFMLHVCWSTRGLMRWMGGMMDGRCE